MFTGIITAIGVVRHIDASPQQRRFTITSPYEAASIAVGASIAHDGCCLTVVEKGCDTDGNWHRVDVSPHTLAHTTLGNWTVGRRVNLERALRAGDELGGHMVSGHVDELAFIREIRAEGDSIHYTMEAPQFLSCYIADKGSVTLDGVSLTVTWAEKHHFGLTLIPHTLQVTTWGARQVGDALNLEIDVVARYVARILGR
jgi:riboflavin synthase